MRCSLAAEYDLILRGGTVVTMDPDRRALDADVGIRGSTIAAIAASLEGAMARVVDARGCVVLPGFVNAHMHETLDRGIAEDLPFETWLQDYALPKDRALEPRHLRAAALMNQAEMIRGGTTSFIDIFRHPNECARVAVESGLRATFSPQVIDSVPGAGETVDASLAFVEAWHGAANGRIRGWFGPHSLYTCRPETFQVMAEHARRLGVGLHTHLAESRHEAAMIAEASKGLSPVAWLDQLIGLGPDVLAAHCIELDEDDIDLLIASGTGIAHCPTSNAKLANRVAPIATLHARGARLGIGTDSNMTNNNLDMFEELRLAALVQRQSTGDPMALTSGDALAMATIGSATVLGLNGRVGSIEVGKAADLIVVDLRHPHTRPVIRKGATNIVEHLVWSAAAGDVRHTIVDGQVLMEDRRLVSLDLDEIGDLVDREILDLLTTAGILDDLFPDT